MTQIDRYFKNSLDFPIPVLHLKFGEKIGTVAYDSSPNKNHGTIAGATWGKGILGPGLHCDGLNDGVQCPSISAYDITDAITLATWVYNRALTGDANTIIGRWISSYWLYTVANEVVKHRLKTSTGIDDIASDGGGFSQ